MSIVILLDAGPLGLITNPRASQETRECNQWLESLALKEIQVKIPEIADFEVRRELLRADKFKGIERLNDLQKYLDYVPLTTQTMLKACAGYLVYPFQNQVVNSHAGNLNTCVGYLVYPFQNQERTGHAGNLNAAY